VENVLILSLIFCGFGYLYERLGKIEKRFEAIEAQLQELEPYRED
jgi:hypothetical protein